MSTVFLFEGGYPVGKTNCYDAKDEKLRVVKEALAERSSSCYTPYLERWICIKFVFCEKQKFLPF